MSVTATDCLRISDESRPYVPKRRKFNGILSVRNNRTNREAATPAGVTASIVSTGPGPVGDYWCLSLLTSSSPTDFNCSS